MKIDIRISCPKDAQLGTENSGTEEFIHLEHRNCMTCMMKGDKLFQRSRDNCFKASVREEMDTTGVDIQVLSTIRSCSITGARSLQMDWRPHVFNDHMAEAGGRRSLTASSDWARFHCRISISPSAKWNVASKIAIAGIRRSAVISMGRTYPIHPSFPFYEAAEKLGAALFVHPEMMGEAPVQRYWLPWLVGMPPRPNPLSHDLRWRI